MTGDGAMAKVDVPRAISTSVAHVQKEVSSIDVLADIIQEWLFDIGWPAFSVDLSYAQESECMMDSHARPV